MKKREISRLRRRKKTQQDAAIDKLMRDIACWDKHAMAELMAMGFCYQDSLRLTLAWRAIRAEPMGRDERIEYLNECLRWGCVL